MSDFQEYKNEQLSDSEFAVEYEAMRLKYEVIRAVIDARLACNMTQKELAEKTGIQQVESGASSPTVDMLARIAAGLGKKLKIEFL